MKRSSQRYRASGQLRRDRRVEIVDDEREIGNGVIVTLKPGWRFQDVGEHIFGEDTPFAALSSLARCEPCTCAECQKQYVKVDERLWPSGLQRVDGKPCTILSDMFASYEKQRKDRGTP